MSNMKLTKHQSNHFLYFQDERGRIQGEVKEWYENGELWLHLCCLDGLRHGEYREWDEWGRLEIHAFDRHGIEVINFLENPELYPATPEEKLMFVLKYGNAPFIGENE